MFLFHATRWPGHEIALQEIQLFAGGNRLIPVSGATNPEGSSPAANQPSNVVDGNLTFPRSKWVDVNMVHRGTSMLVLRLAAAQRVEEYSFWTANDNPGRDPTAWQLHALVNGEWHVIDERRNIVPPKARLATYGVMTLLPSSSPELTGISTTPSPPAPPTPTSVPPPPSPSPRLALHLSASAPRTLEHAWTHSQPQQQSSPTQQEEEKQQQQQQQQQQQHSESHHRGGLGGRTLTEIAFLCVGVCACAAAAQRRSLSGRAWPGLSRGGAGRGAFSSDLDQIRQELQLSERAVLIDEAGASSGGRSPATKRGRLPPTRQSGGVEGSGDERSAPIDDEYRRSLDQRVRAALADDESRSGRPRQVSRDHEAEAVLYYLSTL